MKRRHLLLVFLLFLAIITYLDRVCISVLGSSMQEDLGLSPAQWGWMLGIFSLAYGLFEMPAGMLGDRLGPRRVLTRIVSAWSFFTLLTGFVTSFWQLLVVRGLFGMGEAGAFPNAAAAISRWFPKRERARAQGVIWMASRIGGAITPLIVIPLLHAYGWRACFYIFGVAGLAWPALWYWWFRDNPTEVKGEPRLDEAAPPADPIATSHHPSWRQMLADPNLLRIMLMYYACCWTSFFYLGWLYTFLEKGRAFGKEDLIRFSWIPFLFGAVAALSGGLVSDFLSAKIGVKWGRRSVAIAGLAVSAFSVGAVLLTQSKEWVIFWLALGYAGSDFMLPVAFAVCLDIGGRNAGAVTGAMNMAGQLGAFSTSVIFGYIVSCYGSYDLPLIPMALMTAIAATLWFWIDPSRQVAAQMERRTTSP